ncbi:PHD finger protein 7 [Drosophila takahashii]|uniref:PHD finger protein 7 n=1 Tax=Drosophila takahashii TaxID=29030 RepID=UPI001CF84AAD|nr:PHD finger protein 7 [Drosophila takahashii]
MVNMCVLCRSSESDELIFGKTIREGALMVHHNCLYLSSNLVQRGNKRIGILRFLKDDIVAEARRCKQLNCFYCHKPGANIGCCKSGCRRTFHTKCGVDNLAQSQFRDTYKSYCHQHVRHHRFRPSSDQEPCVICKDPLIAGGERFNVVTMLYSPCCRNGWYHRNCLQAYANTAGYFFKCPLCNNAKVFHDVALMGISLSSQDASWETEPNAFAEHFVRPLDCTAEDCLALAGRSDTSISLYYCNNCGSNPSHSFCTAQDQETYVCGICSIVSPAPPPSINSNDDEEELSSSSDECDPLETFARERRSNNQTINQTAANNSRDFIHSKLCVSGWDDTDTEDDEEVFQRAVEVKQPAIPADELPSTSAAAVNRRSRRLTMAAMGAADVEKENKNSGAAEAATRRRSLRLSAQNNQENTEPTTSGSTSSTIRSRRTMPARRIEKEEKQANEEAEKKKRCLSPNRRFLRSISPNEVKPLRRRTMASSNPSHGLMDMSCVANRTRNRLPGYLAHRK